MEHFVTVFNSLFLPQGLALYDSMQKNLDSFKLWVVCVDQKTVEILSTFNYEHLKIIDLDQVAPPELIALKTQRTIGEYCWTTTPFSCRFVFEADPSIKRSTYVDADLWFRKNPKVIFGEFEKSGKDVLITDHAYAPEYDQSEVSGQYCVQFMIVNNNLGGEKVRKWWEERCIEWCFNRIEDGKFGDQKYLDDWPERFESNVHVLQNTELAMAPWNATRFPYGNAVFWHFHDMRITKIFSNYYIISDIYSLPTIVKKTLYKQYANILKNQINKLAELNYKVEGQKNNSLLEYIKEMIKGITSQLWRYNKITFYRVN